jgi:HK97 gp10 family phage protein
MSALTIEGLDELLAKLKGMPAAIVKGVDIELKDGAEQIAGIAKSNAPANTGLLQQGIGAEKEGDLSYNVYSNAEYSAFVEFGTLTKVQIPPGLEEYAAQFKGGTAPGALSAKEAIFAWCRDKGIEEAAWFAIFISIMTNGIEPQPFFFPAKDIQEPKIIQSVENALKEAV